MGFRVWVLRLCVLGFTGFGAEAPRRSRALALAWPARDRERDLDLTEGIDYK